MPLSVCEKRCSTINMTLMTMATVTTLTDDCNGAFKQDLSFFDVVFDDDDDDDDGDDD